MRFRDNTLSSRLFKASVFPVPERLLGAMKQDFVKGGKYLNTSTREDMTGRTLSGGSIRVGDGDPHPTRGSKVTFHTSDRDATPATPADGGRVKVNLFKQKAGWKWNGDSANRKEATVVSVEHRGKHTYALAAHFAHPFTLARYADSPSEPRLRPTTRGVVDAGPVAGHISVRGRLHPVHEHVVIRSGKKPDGAIRGSGLAKGIDKIGGDCSVSEHGGDLVARRGGQEVGRLSHDALTGSVVRVRMLHVEPHARRQGVSGLLYRELAARNPGASIEGVVGSAAAYAARVKAFGPPDHISLHGSPVAQGDVAGVYASRLEPDLLVRHEPKTVSKGIDKTGGAANSAFDFDAPVTLRTPKAPLSVEPAHSVDTAWNNEATIARRIGECRDAANAYRDGLRSDAHRTFATHVIRNIFGEGGRIPHHKDIRGNEQEQLLNATQASRITKRVRDIERGAYHANTDIAKGIDKIGGASNSVFDFDAPVTPKAPRMATPRKVAPPTVTGQAVMPSPDTVVGAHHAEAMRLIHAHEALHHKSHEEHALLVSPHTGKKLWEATDGSEDSVSIPPELIDDVRKNHPGAYFTHNHPSGWDYPEGHVLHASRGLSPDDVNMAAKLRVGQMRASSPTHVYIARPPTSGWTNGERHMEPGDYHPIGIHYSRADHEVHESIGEQINNGETSYDQANAKHHHEVLNILHDRGILRYERVEKGKEKT